MIQSKNQTELTDVDNKIEQLKTKTFQQGQKVFQNYKKLKLKKQKRILLKNFNKNMTNQMRPIESIVKQKSLMSLFKPVKIFDEKKQNNFFNEHLKQKPLQDLNTQNEFYMQALLSSQMHNLSFNSPQHLNSIKLYQQASKALDPFEKFNQELHQSFTLYQKFTPTSEISRSSTKIPILQQQSIQTQQISNSFLSQLERILEEQIRLSKQDTEEFENNPNFLNEQQQQSLRQRDQMIVQLKMLIEREKKKSSQSSIFNLNKAPLIHSTHSIESPVTQTTKRTLQSQIYSLSQQTGFIINSRVQSLNCFKITSCDVNCGIKLRLLY
jgi:hypothetical protein